MIVQLIKHFYSLLKLQSSKYYFGFVNGHGSYSEEDVRIIRQYLNGDRPDSVRKKYEEEFARLVGDGNAIAFAAGRMAFYVLLKTFGVGKDDEVLITGFTCSVMINAIMRAGAKPVFVDIDPDTLGTSPESIAKKITSKSKLIVAQHSFGIPCDIIKIAEIAKQHNLYLVEDCALTIDSEISGMKVGNFGDAAIFSTDHSKPLNTLIGGLLYTNDHELFLKVKENFKTIEELEPRHQERLFDRFLYERKYFNPSGYKKTKLFEFYRRILRKLFSIKNEIVFLEDEEAPGSSDNSPGSYPYPALLPEFLSCIGKKELDNWEKIKTGRRRVLNEFLKIVEDSDKKDLLPRAYYDPGYDIIPHRFVLFSDNKSNFINNVNNELDTKWFWFEKPVVTTKMELEKYGYKKGDCPVSESIGEKIINFPVDIEENYEKQLISFFDKSIKSL